jgi:hypothetical protein
MNPKKLLLSFLALAALVGAWAAFRPERLWVNQEVHEDLMPAAQASASAAVVARGTFRTVHHETRGTVAVYRLEDGARVVRFTQFATSNGPDVHVILVNAADAADDAAVKRAGFVDLGSIKGNVGDQNYVLPAGFDASKPFAVTVWCKRFGANFGTAAVTPVS